MLTIYENSKLYSHPQDDVKALKHSSAVQAKLLVLIKSNVAINPELVEMLDKIIAALKIEASAAEYLVFPEKVFLSQLANQYKAENVLVFGAECEDLNLNMTLKPFKVYEINKTEVLLVNNIIDIYGNQNLKSMLWKHLQTMI